jgi:hypothetical protein
MSVKGWYPDLHATFRERYFDGAVWTDRYRDVRKLTPEERRAKRLRSLTLSLALCTFPVAMLLLRWGAVWSVGYPSVSALYKVLSFGPTLISVITIAVSFFVRRFRFGLAVPLIAWALLLAATAGLAVTPAVS